MILNQANRDDAVSRLLSKVSEVYALLVMGHEGLVRIASVLEIYGMIARQTLECADFVSNESPSLCLGTTSSRTPPRAGPGYALSCCSAIQLRRRNRVPFAWPSQVEGDKIRI